ncbi:methyltransferase domain-containing protein [Candidatus Saganbacteria bacterium]|nr:methyltransferase domain-containing protein [Candidatus Saganbacteria bacterium]
MPLTRVSGFSNAYLGLPSVMARLVRSDMAFLGININRGTLRSLSGMPPAQYYGLHSRLEVFQKGHPFSKFRIDAPDKFQGFDFSVLPDAFLSSRVSGVLLDLANIETNFARFEREKQMILADSGTPAAFPVQSITPRPPIVEVDSGAIVPSQEPGHAAIVRPKHPVKNPISAAALFKNAYLFLLFIFVRAKVRIIKAFGAGGGEKAALNIVDLKNEMGEKIVAIIDYPENVPKSEASFAPWVIIPPAWGKTKETYFLLALYLQKNGFGVMRYDDTHGPGESDGQIVDSTLSISSINVSAAVDYLSKTIGAANIAVAPFSLSTRAAIKAASRDKRIAALLPIVGSPNIQSLLRNVYGEDLVAANKDGKKIGMVNMIGNYTDGDNFLDDVRKNRFSDLDTTARDLEKVKVPIIWYCGSEDEWVDPKEVEAALSSHSARHEVKVVEGVTHRFREAQTAHLIFIQFTRDVVGLMMGNYRTEVAVPGTSEIMYRGMIERSRIAVEHSKEKERQNWENYLEGFDILLESDDYRSYIREVAEAVDFVPGERLADIGCGTGNFEEYLLNGILEEILKSGITGSGGEITAIDIVANGLAKTMEKVDQVRRKRQGLPNVVALQADADISFLRVIERFKMGEVELEGLNELMCGCNINIPKIKDRQKLRSFLRGDLRLNYLDLMAIAGIENIDVVIELDRARRYIEKKIGLDDFNKKGQEKVSASGRIDYGELLIEDLKFDQLDWRMSLRNTTLPLKEGAYDKIVLSLCLSYLRNPRGTLAEIRRAQKPGGRIVVTSLKPDADISRIYSRFLGKIKEKYQGEGQGEALSRARALFNDAIKWIEVEEESGRFVYFSEEQLREMLIGAGYSNIQISYSFDKQALIAAGELPLE